MRPCEQILGGTDLIDRNNQSFLDGVWTSSGQQLVGKVLHRACVQFWLISNRLHQLVNGLVLFPGRPPDGCYAVRREKLFCSFMNPGCILKQQSLGMLAQEGISINRSVCLEFLMARLNLTLTCGTYKSIHTIPHLTDWRPTSVSDIWVWIIG